MKLAAVAGLALVLGLAFQGSRPLYEPDEGRYSAAALEMLRVGDWLTPRLHRDQPHLTKPPLTYWALAASMAAFGDSEWALRLPNALAFAATALAVGWLGLALVPRRPWLPAAIWATSLLPFVAANALTTDTLLALWETVAVAAFVAWRWSGRRSPAGLLAMWAALGLGFLTKGPPALLPLAAVALFTVLDGGPGELRRLLSPAGLALFGLLGVGWFVVLGLRSPELLPYWLGDEVAGRLFTGRHHRNGDPLGAIRVYLPVLIGGTLPWTPALVAGAWSLARRLRIEGARAALARNPRTPLLLAWILVPLAVFAVARSRMPLYLLPLTVPLALAAAAHLEERFRPSRSRLAALAAWAAVLIGLKAAAAYYPVERDARRLAGDLEAIAGRPAELVFVDTHPRYGLAFYLDAEVESVTLRESGGEPRGHSLREELEEGDHPRLFLVPPHFAGRFSTIAAETGRGVETLGRWHDLALLHLAPARPEAAGRLAVLAWPGSPPPAGGRQDHDAASRSIPRPRDLRSRAGALGRAGGGDPGGRRVAADGPAQAAAPLR